MFVKITTTLPNMVATARDILEKQGLLVGLAPPALTFQAFESNVLYTCDSWWIAGGRQKLGGASRGMLHAPRKQSMCQYECDVRYDKGGVSPAPDGPARSPRSASCPWTSSARDARDTSRTRNTIPSFRSPPWYVRVPGKRMTGRRLFFPGLATVSLPRSPPAEGENQTDVFLFLLSWNCR